MQMGIVHPNKTLILWAERDFFIKQDIRKFLEENDFNHTGFDSMEHLIQHALHLSSQGQQIDLAFVDLCGEMTESVRTMLDILAEAMTTDSLVGVTIQDYARHPNTLKFNQRPRMKNRGEAILSRHKNDILKLGTYDTSRCTVTPGIVGNITDSLYRHELQQIILYRSPSKLCNMSLTIMS
jgi:hypothetical protein